LKIKHTLWVLIPIFLIAIIYLSGYTETVLYYLYYYFAMMLMITIQLIQQGDGGYAFATALLQIVAWFIFFYLMAYRFAFNMIFPKIRIVDNLKNAINYSRKVTLIDGPDPRFVYMKVKFKLFPILRWHTFKVPKPEYQGKRKIKNGVPGVRWMRMPSSIDIISDELNIEWNGEENTYQLTPNYLPRIDDVVDNYRYYSQNTLKRLASNITESIRGNSNLLKEKYQMGMPLPSNLIDDDDEDIPTKPLNSIKEVKDEKEMKEYVDKHD